MELLDFNSLKLVLEENVQEIDFNGNQIQIKSYLPIEDKMAVIQNIVNQTFDDNTYINSCRYDIYSVLEIVYAYSNLQFSDEEKANPALLYDLLLTSGLWEKISSIISSEINYIKFNAQAMLDGLYQYKNSALGILDAVNQDYANLNLEAENIQRNLADPNNLSLLKDVVTKLG